MSARLEGWGGRAPLMLRDAALRAAPQHEGESHALAFAYAMNARQPPKAEMSRALCVGAARYGTRSRFELVAPSVLPLQAASVFLTMRQS